MLQLTAGEATLEDALEDWARSYRSVFAAYPSLIPLIAVTPVSDAPQTLHMYNAVAEAVIAAGVPEDRVFGVIVAFDSLVIGSALDMNTSSVLLHAGEASEDDASLDQT